MYHKYLVYSSKVFEECRQNGYTLIYAYKKISKYFDDIFKRTKFYTLKEGKD